MFERVLSKHLRCHVLWASAVGIGDLIVVDTRFGQSKICDFNVSLCIKQYILQLDISEDNAVLVKIFET